MRIGSWMEDVLWGYHTHPKRQWDTMRNHSSFTFRPSARHGACSLCATWLNSVPSATTKAPRSNHRDQTRAKTMRWGAKEQTRINSPFSQDHTHTHGKYGGKKRRREEYGERNGVESMDRKASNGSSYFLSFFFFLSSVNSSFAFWG